MGTDCCEVGALKLRDCEAWFTNVHPFWLYAWRDTGERLTGKAIDADDVVKVKNGKSKFVFIFTLKTGRRNRTYRTCWRRVASRRRP